MRSPSGGIYVPADGPIDAEIVGIGESPGGNEAEQGKPFVGRGGKVLDKGLHLAGLPREKIRLINAVPTRAPGDKFDMHKPSDLAWGMELLNEELKQLKNAKVIIPMGNNPLRILTGISGISNWRGSWLPVERLRSDDTEGVKENYLSLYGHNNAHPALQDHQHILPTYHPAAVAKQFSWHPWFVLDLKRAKRVLGGEAALPKRRWHFDDLSALEEFADRLGDSDSHRGFIAIDTESYPYEIVGFASENDVYVVQWDEKYRAVLEKIFTSPLLLKVAHNLQHDWTWLYKKHGIKVSLPWFDTMGGAHVLHTSMEVNLSPAIATRYTWWPYHKWMVDYDAMWYNGLDCVVAYDAYWPEIDELMKRGLYDVAKHDHHLLEPLLDMQWHGFKVDEEARVEEEQKLGAKRDAVIARLQQDVAPIVQAKIGKFTKPHLFRVLRSCECCGGGKKSREHCWRCGKLETKPKAKGDYSNAEIDGVASYCSPQGPCVPLAKNKVANLQALLPTCKTCAGSGKVEKNLPFNPDSPDQVADVLYRGAGIRARKYKGVETIRVGQIEPLVGKHPIVEPLVTYARINTDYETVSRLRGGPDGRLHCVFDPLVGTESGRVASKEGLVEVGTNAMNIPKDSRKFVVPDEEDMVFLYPDMAAVEARAIAVISRDERLIQVFNDGADFHSLVRDDIQKLIPNWDRNQSKRLDFGVPYGGEAPQLTKELIDEALRKKSGEPNLSVVQVQGAIDILMSGWYRGVKAWQEGIEKQLLATRTLKSITGRLFEFPDYIYDAKTKGIKREIIKKAYSREPQDIGAWVLGLGMIDVWKMVEKWKGAGPVRLWVPHGEGGTSAIRGLIHVHDALLFMCKKQDEEEASAVVTKALTREIWGMKFTTSVKSGANWKEAS